MRNEAGELVAYVSPLDTVVTLARSTRSLAHHANAIREAMESSSGHTVACCTALASNFDLQAQVDFAVDHEPARPIRSLQGQRQTGHNVSEVNTKGRLSAAMRVPRMTQHRMMRSRTG
jgi:hypothetical protein